MKTTLIVLTAGLGASIAIAQVSGHQHDSSVELKVVIDGAKNPELIPDDLAMRHFLLSIAESRNPSATDVDRRASHLRAVGLSEADNAGLIRALDGVREEIDAVQAERVSVEKNQVIPDVDKADALEKLRIREHVATDIAATRVSQFMSAEGWQRLQAYLNDYVKRHIQVLEN